METPISDFIKKYKEKNPLRLHMPGHKGKCFLGVEELDITEIDGADVLYSSEGIIEESQKNAASLFGTGSTLYSCEGSSLSIRSMLYLALLTGNGKSKTILAARNAHRVFMSASAMLDFNVEWLYSEDYKSIISCEISPEFLDEKLSQMKDKPVAVYITSPDYLGNVADIASLSRVCHKHNVLLICDNAHGAYLNFLPESKHPIALGADMCCDSAHKTLPVLTGGGYLHISKNAPSILSEKAKKAMSLFASTSPSYLILHSLDLANRYLCEGYREKLGTCIDRINNLKRKLAEEGFCLMGNEDLKITIAPKSYGYSGFDIANYLESQNIVCEFSDPDFIVLMFSPEMTGDEFDRLQNALLHIPKKDAIKENAPKFQVAKKITSAREALFSVSEIIPVEASLGRILACDNVSCPPAIPIAVCGEEINESVVELFKYYGIEKVEVVAE